MIWPLIILGALATYRISILLSREDGPQDILARMRAHLASKQQKRGGWYDLVSCPSCVSIYAGFIIALIITRDPLYIFLMTFAFSGASIILSRGK